MLVKETTLYDLLITGHEDGSVKFWDIRNGEAARQSTAVLSYAIHYLITVSMCPMLTIRSSEYFEQLEDLRSPSPTPHQFIRSIGLWDPRCDDDRIIVTCIQLVGSQLSIGFQGGQCLVLKPNNQSATCAVSVSVCSLDDTVKLSHTSL